MAIALSAMACGGVSSSASDSSFRSGADDAGADDDGADDPGADRDADTGDAESNDAPDSNVANEDPLVGQLCPGACAAAVEWDDRVQLAACLEQCAKEVTGDGYLIPEVAIQFFAFINADTNEDGQRCWRIKTFGDWQQSPWLPGGVEIEMEGPAANEICVERYGFCHDRDNVENVCWRIYYRYNHPLREKIRECLMAPCSPTWRFCIDDLQPEGQPWLAIPAWPVP